MAIDSDKRVIPPLPVLGNEHREVDDHDPKEGSEHEH